MRSAVVSITLILRFVLCCGWATKSIALSPLSQMTHCHWLAAETARAQRHQGEGAGAAGSSPDPAHSSGRGPHRHTSRSRGRARDTARTHNIYGTTLFFSHGHTSQGGIPLLNKLSSHNTHRTLATLTIEAHMRHARHANIRYTSEHAHAWGPCPINKPTVHSCSLQT